MSLLLNLINYSSSMQSQYQFSLPRQQDKDERARSLHYAKLNQQNQRAKMSSKSLTKLLAEKPQSNLNPKTRILHRILHLLSIKCKKQYYGLFVTLQTIKKRNLYLTQEGLFDKYQNRKIPTKNNQIQTEHITQEEKKAFIFKFLNKVEEIQKIYLIKQFQQHIKLQFFNSIKNDFLYKDRLQKFVQKIESYQQKLQRFKTFKKLKKINHFCFKIEMLSTLIVSLTKKYSKKKRQLSKAENLHIFNKIKLSRINSEKIQVEFEKISEQNETSIKLINFETQQIKVCTEQNKQLPVFDKQNTQTSQKIAFRQEKNIQQSELFPKENEVQKQISILNVSPKKFTENRMITSLKQIKPLQNLRDRLNHQQKRKFQRNELNITKSLKVRTYIQQKPIITQKDLFNDKTSNFCKKLPKNYIRVCYNDSNEEFSLFSNDKMINQSEQLRLNATNIFKQSRVTPYRNKKATKMIENNINSMLIQTDKNLQEISCLSISDISEVSQFKTQKSTNTLFNDKSFNFSTIGTDAVNFKNSLVHQRQSLKEGDMDFMKKRQNYSQNQTTTLGKGFLRSTLDSKTKNKIQQQLTADRAFSKDKASQISGRLFAFDNDLRQISRPRQPYWTRPSSRDGLSRLDKEVQNQIILNSSNNQFFIQNQTIFPTRDDSLFTAEQNSNKVIKKNPQNHSSLIDKSSKQKSFIKLLSKRQIPFIKQSK